MSQASEQDEEEEVVAHIESPKDQLDTRVEGEQDEDEEEEVAARIESLKEQLTAERSRLSKILYKKVAVALTKPDRARKRKLVETDATSLDAATVKRVRDKEEDKHNGKEGTDKEVKEDAKADTEEDAEEGAKEDTEENGKHNNKPAC